MSKKKKIAIHPNDRFSTVVSIVLSTLALISYLILLICK
mgnify:CR=1 FL=1